MIEFKNEDIFEQKTEAIVNTVNCVGVMGKGIALQFKKAFPENFQEYNKLRKYIVETLKAMMKNMFKVDLNVDYVGKMQMDLNHIHSFSFSIKNCYCLTRAEAMKESNKNGKVKYGRHTNGGNPEMIETGLLIICNINYGYWYMYCPRPKCKNKKKYHYFSDQYKKRHEDVLNFYK